MRSAVPRHHQYTFKEYLDADEMSTIKLEYLNGNIYAMAGGTAEHSAVSARLIAQLVALVGNGPCEAHTSDLRIRVRATGLATYADAAIVCGPVEPDPESPTHCTNPAVIFEVLSPATESYDRGAKREHYQQIDSLREYVIVAQERPHAEQWTRDERGRWTHRVIEGEGEIVLPVPGGSIKLHELYRAARL